MAVILFIDMLGARKLWHRGGVAEALPVFYRFKSVVTRAAHSATAGAVLEGMIETDSAMLVCRSTMDATRIAQSVYLRAFAGQMNPKRQRDWYRGCIVPHADGDFLRVGARLRAPFQDLTAFRYSESALEAVSVEKSGFKGMRLLVATELVDSTVRAQTKIPFGTKTLVPFRKLHYSSYPDRIDGQYMDFLWMACQSEDDWYDRYLHMTSRLRYASADPEELAQAAATQVVFHECAAIRYSVLGRSKRAEEEFNDP
jgi:hypothetical protein